MENRFFPRDYADALTMLYLQNQDLSGKTPEQILDMYEDTNRRIRTAKADGGLKQESPYNKQD